MELNLLLQILAVTFQCLGVIVTLTGFFFVLYQIRSAQRNAMTSSFISVVANHWILLEERRMKISGGEWKIKSSEVNISFRGLWAKLEKKLSADYANDLKAMADDYLFGDQSEVIRSGKNALLDAIVRESVLQDHIFNLYEEEFIAGKYLNLVNRKLWNYWDSYMRKNFESPVVRNHWNLRLEMEKEFPQFAEFVRKEYFPKSETEKATSSSQAGAP
jgi:hypothetical protein